MCSFLVTVRDSTPPVVKCPSTLAVPTTDAFGTQASVVYPSATASDDSGVAPAVSYSILSGSDFVLGGLVGLGSGLRNMERILYCLTLFFLVSSQTLL